MLTKVEIRKWAGATSYARGADIFALGRVLSFRVEDDEAFHIIEATVKGSGHNRYDVSMELDATSERLESAYCDCPAFSSYSGICKHCVAVLLTYEEYCKRQMQVKDFNPQKESGLARIAALRGMKQSTTPAIKKLLEQQIVKKMLPITAEDTYGRVELQPLLECNDYGITLEFRIGTEHKYVLKDIFGFVEMLRGCKEYSYGKQLSFLHTEEAFTKDSQPLLGFIKHWAAQNRERYLQTSYYGYSYTSTTSKIRKMSLTTVELESFIEAIGDRSILINVNDAGAQRYQITNEAVPRELQITGQNGGIELKINSLFGYNCDQYHIYLMDGKIYRVLQTEVETIQPFLNSMVTIPSRTAFIETADIAGFCQTLLPDLKEVYSCTYINFDENNYAIEPVSFKIYLDMPQKDFITVKVMAVYGQAEYEVYGDDKTEAITRDFAREIAVGKKVSSYCNAYDEEKRMMVLGQDEDRLYILLTEGIPHMQELGEVFISDALRKLRINETPKVAVGVSVDGNIMQLSLTSEDMPREQLIEILSKYNRKKKYYRLKNGEFVHMQGEEMEAVYRLKNSLALTDSQLKLEKIELPKYRALYLEAEFKEHPELGAWKSREFLAMVRNMKTVEHNDFEIPVRLESILREYQKRGFLWIKMLHANGFGGILADDMGLGKTLQVISFMLSEYLEADSSENRRCLIVAPASLIYNWQNEIERFAPCLPVTVVAGDAQSRQMLIEESMYRDILITSYDLLRRDIAVYEKIDFYCQVIDEAQYIKNHTTQAAKAVKSIHANFRLALTGTPVENRLSELWSIFDFVMPGFLYGYKRFREEMEIPIVQNKDEMELQHLQKLIKPFVLRRLKKDVLSDLPDKLEENMYAQLGGEQQELYDAHVKRMQVMLDKTSDDEFKKSKIQILSELTKLRQICCDPALLYDNYKGGSAKLDMCMDMVISAVASGHKILLFSQFTSMLAVIEERLQKEDISYYMLTGATTKEKRTRMVEAFNTDDTSVFCISLKAGGTGLNLTAADIVIHYDPWWNLAVQNQATDRAHRIGQKNVVNVYRLLIKGTIEENITRLQEQKKELADQILSGEGLSEGNLNREELLSLLRQS